MIPGDAPPLSDVEGLGPSRGSPPIPDEPPSRPTQSPDTNGVLGGAPLGPDALSIGAAPYGSQPQTQQTAPIAAEATSPPTTLPSIDSPIPVGAVDMGTVDPLTAALGELGAALAEIGEAIGDAAMDLLNAIFGAPDTTPFVAPATPVYPQSGPDPENNPPPADEPGDSPPDDAPPDDSPPTTVADLTDPLGGDPSDTPGRPGAGWGPGPKGDPPEGQPGGGGTLPPWWGSGPAPGDPPEDWVTGTGDPNGLGQVWDEALGAAAAIAQAIPSARSKITAALDAYFAQHPGAAPPLWLEAMGVLGSLPPGMSLGEYLLEHAQYQPPPGQTYARVPIGGPQSPPDDTPGETPGDQPGLGTGGPGGDEGRGGGGGGGSGTPTDSTDPWPQPPDNLGAGQKGPRHPNPNDPPGM